MFWILIIFKFIETFWWKLDKNIDVKKGLQTFSCFVSKKQKDIACVTLMSIGLQKVCDGGMQIEMLVSTA